MYVLINLRNLIKNSTAMFVILTASMLVSFMVLFFGIGLFYQYSKNIEDGEIDSYAIGFSIRGSVTKEDLASFVEAVPSEQMSDISYITCFSSAEVSGLDEITPIAFLSSI
ncbi:MAG: hypothetical protein LUE12_07285 [Ruminococcus sp.]|nr:hypothetical protein [Ruminococcus sp.]